MAPESDLLLVSTAMSLLRRIIVRLNADDLCPASLAVFDALAAGVEAEARAERRNAAASIEIATSAPHTPTRRASRSMDI
jgi:hypothetical protein